MIAALAGRRIDPASPAVERFPLRLVARVRERIRHVLHEAGVTTLVSAAACGADLAALSVAEELGLRRHIVLPAPVAEFRSRSVTDRPGDWGALFDRLVAEAQRSGDLEVLAVDRQSNPFTAGNDAIVDRSLALAAAAATTVLAIAVWDGPIGGRVDYTEDFVTTAQRRGVPVRTIGIERG